MHVQPQALIFFFFLKDHPLELFTWGSNTNFTLGHRDESTRQVPELLENVQREDKVCIKEVHIRLHLTIFVNKFFLYNMYCGIRIFQTGLI